MSEAFLPAKWLRSRWDGRGASLQKASEDGSKRSTDQAEREFLYRGLSIHQPHPITSATCPLPRKPSHPIFLALSEGLETLRSCRTEARPTKRILQVQVRLYEPMRGRSSSTTFCPRLPQELFDQVIDFLHDSGHALKSCCLVSKQWIPRTQKHLFANIRFRTTDDLRAWKAVFPDPSTSPACYATTLFIGCPRVILAETAGEGCSLSAFSHVAHLDLNTIGRSNIEDRAISLVPFHGFSPVLKSLRMASSAFPHSQIFNLICSFSLLEDVSVSTMGRSSTESDDNTSNEQPTITQLTSPVFTGSLVLRFTIGIKPIASRLLSLPGGLRFRHLSLALHCEADVSLTTALVEECCSTLQSLNVGCGGLDLPQSAQVNLSKATNLEDLVFKFWFHPRLLLTTLRTVTSDHRKLEQVTLAILSSRGLRDCEELRHADGGVAYQEWLELDRLVAQLNESHSIRLKVLLNTRRTDPDGSRERSRIKILFPVVTARGIVDLVSLSRPQNTTDDRQ